jgi:hypothetical protein
MSGEGVKTSSRHSEEGPRELKTREGIERQAELTPLLDVTDRCSEQGPEGGAGGSGNGRVTCREEKLGNDMRV